MVHLPSDVTTWLTGIGNAVVGGAATAGSSWMGMLAGKELGLAVPTLNIKALGAIMVSGALTNLFFFLKQSPLPVKSEKTTVTVEKETTQE